MTPRRLGAVCGGLLTLTVDGTAQRTPRPFIVSPMEAQRLLDAAVFRGERVPAPDPDIEIPTGDLQAVGIAQFVEPSRGLRLPTMRSIDLTGDRPLARVGDTVTAFSVGRGTGVPMVVLARRRITPALLGRGCTTDIWPAWMYVLGGDTTALAAPAGSERRTGVAVVLRGRHASIADLPVPPVIASNARAEFRAIQHGALRSAYESMGESTYDTLAAAGVRRMVLGVDSSARARTITPRALRGPGGETWAAVSFSIPATMHRDSTTVDRTLIYARDGSIAAEFPVAYRIVGAADVDGDGVDEVLTDLGLIRLRGGRWQLPPAAPRLRACR